LAEVSGGLIHGGLAVKGELGALFLAPPQGGKTTTISKLPSPPWRVLGDDTAVFWSDIGLPPRFYASPLPTWSVLLGNNPSILSQDDPKWRVGGKIKIEKIYAIRQGRPLTVKLMTGQEAIRKLFSAFSEHAMVPKVGREFRPYCAGLAIKTASLLSVCELTLSLEDRFWEKID
jgi:hypothetical protein